MRYKKVLTWVTVIFAGILLFLTFFSRTLSDMHLPRVTLDFVQQGIVHPEARSAGLVRAADTEQIFAPVGGRITQILQPGDTINTQTVLFTITSDMRTLTDMLERAEHDVRVATLNIERTQCEIILAAHKMVLERAEAQIYDIAVQIANGGIIEVRLDRDTSRTVTDTFVSPGSQVHEGAAIMHTAVNNNRFYVEAGFPQVQDFIGVGQSAAVVVGRERITGNVTGIVPQGGRNNVTIEVQSNNLRGGESASITVSGGSSSHANTIPLSALREDNDGYFILYIESVPRRFGSGYYVRLQRVEPGRRDNSTVVINSIWGLALPEAPIIVNSSIPVHAGDRVRIVG